MATTRTFTPEQVEAGREAIREIVPVLRDSADRIEAEIDLGHWDHVEAVLMLLTLAMAVAVEAGAAAASPGCADDEVDI